MNENSRYLIDFKDLKSGDHTFDFIVNDDLFAKYEFCEVLAGVCNITVKMQKSESMLALQVSIDGVVTVECDRCLDPCPVNISFNEPLFVKFSDNEELNSVDEYDGEVMWLHRSAKTLDLEHYIYESIILSLPYQRVHEEGECNPEMLAKFRIVSPAEFDKIEQNGGKKEASERASEGAEGEEASEWDEEEEETKSLPQSELAKLAALKAKMTTTEE